MGLLNSSNKTRPIENPFHRYNFQICQSSWTEGHWDADKWCPLGLTPDAMEGAIRYALWNRLRGPYKNCMFNMDEFAKYVFSVFNSGATPNLITRIYITMVDRKHLFQDESYREFRVDIDHKSVAICKIMLFDVCFWTNEQLEYVTKERTYELKDEKLLIY